VIGASELLLVGTVAAVGVLHTVVPDHWVPITLIARQRGWTKGEVARAAAVAGTGHTASTLLIGLCVWFAGVAFANRFGNLVATVSSVGLVAFGLWVAVSSLRELRAGTGHGHIHHPDAPASARKLDHEHNHDLGHLHTHDPERSQSREHGQPHAHGHEDRASAPRYSVSSRGVLLHLPHAQRQNDSTPDANIHASGVRHDGEIGPSPEPVDSGEAPLRDQRRERSLRTTLLLVLGSSPMVEGIPAFFAAAKYGPALVVVMSLVFAVATIATYIMLCVFSLAGLRRLHLGPLERYGEVVSGGFIAAVGLIFFIFPVL
jgi:ABC-type nickel/cobalt efflux system permease component RcnA